MAQKVWWPGGDTTVEWVPHCIPCWKSQFIFKQPWRRCVTFCKAGTFHIQKVSELPAEMYFFGVMNRFSVLLSRILCHFWQEMGFQCTVQHVLQESQQIISCTTSVRNVDDGSNSWQVSWQLSWVLSVFWIMQLYDIRPVDMTTSTGLVL